MRTVVSGGAGFFREATAAMSRRVFHPHRVLRRSDRMLASFPRSGNTWMRYLLADLLQQQWGLRTGTDLPVHPDRVVPDVHSNLLDEVDRRVNPLIIKTHERHDRSRRRTVVIVRRPEDALVSYWHFHRRYPDLRARAAVGVDRFVLDHVDTWRKHVKSYLRAARRRPVRMVTYERMLEDPAAVLTSVASFFGIGATRSEVDHAIEHHQFGRRRRAEERGALNTNEFFFRRGTAGGGRDELSSDTLRQVRDEFGPVYRDAARTARLS